MSSQAELDRFLSLPEVMLKLWAASDSLRAASEDTVIVLISLWLQHNHPHVWTTDFEQFGPDLQNLCKSLSSSVRIPNVSPGFRSLILRRLPWHVWQHAQDYTTMTVALDLALRIGLAILPNGIALHMGARRSGIHHHTYSLGTDDWVKLKRALTPNYTAVSTWASIRVGSYILTPVVCSNAECVHLSFNADMDHHLASVLPGEKSGRDFRYPVSLKISAQLRLQTIGRGWELVQVEGVVMVIGKGAAHGHIDMPMKPSSKGPHDDDQRLTERLRGVVSIKVEVVA